MMLLETVFTDINIIFFTEVWCVCLFIFACTVVLISTYNVTFTSWVITQWEMFSREPDRWYQVESTPCNKKVLIRIHFVAVGLTHEQALYVLTKWMVQANIRQKHQTSVKNVSLEKLFWAISYHYSTKKGNKLYDIFAMKVVFFLVYIVFRVLLK